jgi:hypothetical protein
MRYLRPIRASVNALSALALVLASTGVASAQFGGMGGLGGGAQTQGQAGGGADAMGGSDESQFVAHGRRPPHPLSAAAATTWLKLQQPTTVAFSDGVTLADLAQFITETTKSPDDKAKDDGVSVYVDPVGLQEAEKTMDSKVTLSVKGVPLATSLHLMLAQLGLVYYVQKDGVLIIAPVSASGLEDYASSNRVPVSAKTAKTWLRLHQPVDLSLKLGTQLQEALAAMKAASKKSGEGELSIYVDPTALESMEKTFESPVTIDLAGAPLATCVALIADQLGLTYRVQDDGIVMIVSRLQDDDDDLPEGHGAETIAQLRARLEEEKLKAQIAQYRLRARMPEAAAGGGLQSVFGR